MTLRWVKPLRAPTDCRHTAAVAKPPSRKPGRGLATRLIREKEPQSECGRTVGSRTENC